MPLGPQGRQAERFSGLPLTQQGSKSPLELPKELLPAVTVQRLTEAHGRSWLSPWGDCTEDLSVPHLASSRAWSFGDALRPGHAPPSSPSPLPPQSLVGTVMERLVGLQLGGRKEGRKKSQPEKRMINFFLTWFPWLLALCPHPQQHGCSWTCCHSHPCGAPGLCSHPGASQATGLAACRDPWAPHITAEPVLSWVRLRCGGEWALHTLPEPHCASLAALGGPSPCGRTPDGPKEGAALTHHQRRV